MTDLPELERGAPRQIGRYEIWDELARGGMASVHIGRLVGDRGFSRLIAAKMLRADRAGHAYARALEHEARVVARIRHPNVVQTLDVVAAIDEVVVVMEYIEGASLARLLQLARAEGAAMPAAVVARVVVDGLKGLEAAHLAKDEGGRPLGIVHRDVSPHNVLVGVDGLARLADFGVAKVARPSEHTQTGVVKGKLLYMSPEQARGLPLTRQADVYSAGIVLAQALTGERPPERPEDVSGWLEAARGAIDDPAIARVVQIATRPDPRERFESAAEMAAALELATELASAEQVGRWVTRLAADDLELRGEIARRIEQTPAGVAADERRPLSRSQPPPIDATSPALAADREQPRDSIVGPTALVLAGLVALVALVLASTWTRKLASRAEPAATPQSSASVVSVAPQIASVAAPLPPFAPPPEAVGSLTTQARPSPSSGRAPPTRRATPPESSRRAPVADPCDPAFTVDANGKKHYRAECLPRE